MEFCDKCGKILGEAESFENHWKRVYNVDGIPMCEECNEEEWKKLAMSDD